MISKIALDGFDYVYSGLLGNYQGIFPGYGGYSEYKESGKTYIEKYPSWLYSSGIIGIFSKE